MANYEAILRTEEKRLAGMEARIEAKEKKLQELMDDLAILRKEAKRTSEYCCELRDRSRAQKAGVQ